jgi:hypothetical protein
MLAEGYRFNPLRHGCAKFPVKSLIQGGLALKDATAQCLCGFGKISRNSLLIPVLWRVLRILGRI